LGCPFSIFFRKGNQVKNKSSGRTKIFQTASRRFDRAPGCVGRAVDVYVWIWESSSVGNPLPMRESQIGNSSVSAGIVASRDDFGEAPGEAVAQVSKPAVSLTSKLAERVRMACGFGNPRHSRLGSLRYFAEYKRRSNRKPNSTLAKLLFGRAAHEIRGIVGASTAFVLRHLRIGK